MAARLEEEDGTSSSQEALQIELDMLMAIYPEQVRWHARRRELLYSSSEAEKSFLLRVPDDYPGAARPEVLVAAAEKQDVRDKLQAIIKHCELGVEILDLVVDRFESIEAPEMPQDMNVAETIANTEQSRTIVVWLHHLLNTNKRKQALSPALPGVSGLTKPGYPGVLVYAGPARAVTEHVQALRSLNWQAFQVRLDIEEEWRFLHVSGVVEVETMSEVVSAVGPANKQTFLQAMNIT